MGQKPTKLEVAEQCLKPHQPHKCSDVDLRKLKTLIKAGKLAPCNIPYEGEDWDSKGVSHPVPCDESRGHGEGELDSFMRYSSLH